MARRGPGSKRPAPSWWTDGVRGKTPAFWPANPQHIEMRDAITGHTTPSPVEGFGDEHQVRMARWFKFLTQLDIDEPYDMPIEDVYATALKVYGTHDAIIAAAHLLRDD